METITVDQMQRDLPGYLRRVNAGETLVIVEGDTPVVELKPVAPSARGIRPFGLSAGQFSVPDDFDAPLPDSVLADFESE
jgi:antitoxin (DNA-binding transcriptional repressor) of toxin-antitoxin stability system